MLHPWCSLQRIDSIGRSASYRFPLIKKFSHSGQPDIGSIDVGCAGKGTYVTPVSFRVPVGRGYHPINNTDIDSFVWELTGELLTPIGFPMDCPAHGEWV